MLQRTLCNNGLILYQSPRLADLGVIHAFTTRRGGASRGPYASLNLARLEKSPTNDFNLAVAENFRRLRRALNHPRLIRAETRQVHGADIWHVTGRPVKPAAAPAADAMITREPNRMLTIRTADCVPILFAARDGKTVAAAHAGWRGIVAGVIPATVRALAETHRLQPQDVVAAIGPAISADHFQVGPDVAAAFEQAGLRQAIHRNPRRLKPHIDLPAAALCQLGHAGIPLDQIDTTDACTFRDEADFFSHRRDQGTTGRMAAVIAVPAP